MGVRDAMTMERPARLIDIAGEVGVHPSVVSRTLSNDPKLNIRPETREQIRATATRLGYRGNSSARALRGATVGAIAVAIPSLRNPVWGEIVRGALSAAEKHHMALLMAEVPDGSSDDESYVRLVEEGRIDGLLIGSSEPRMKRGGWPPKGVPTVHVNRGAEGADCNIMLDEAKAISIPLRHLAQLGHRKVALIDGPTTVDTVTRRAAAGVSLAPSIGLDLRISNRAFDEGGGYEGMRALLTSKAKFIPSAVIVSSLPQLVGALAAIREHGRSVPHDLSLICLDDDSLLDFLDVKVTSVRMPLFELGMAAAEALVAKIHGASVPSAQVDSPMELVERSSTARIQD